MNALNIRTASVSRARGRAGTPAVAALALAVLVGIGATQSYSRHADSSGASAPPEGAPAQSQPFVSHALQVAPDAETYSDSNPQPPTF